MKYSSLLIGSRYNRPLVSSMKVHFLRPAQCDGTSLGGLLTYRAVQLRREFFGGTLWKPSADRVFAATPRGCGSIFPSSRTRASQAPGFELPGRWQNAVAHRPPLQSPLA